MGRKGFEQLLGFHAAPLFAGIKSACLLSFRRSAFEDFDALLAEYETCFHCKGIEVFRVAEGEEYVLLLFYRPAILWRRLQEPEVQAVLAQYGYGRQDSLWGYLDHLQARMRLRKSFPHEIGLFLDYPVGDVVSFITHKGRDFCYSGYWKVYVNEEETRALFARYARCSEEFCSRLEKAVHSRISCRPFHRKQSKQEVLS